MKHSTKTRIFAIFALVWLIGSTLATWIIIFIDTINAEKNQEYSLDLSELTNTWSIILDETNTWSANDIQDSESL